MAVTEHKTGMVFRACLFKLKVSVKGLENSMATYKARAFPLAETGYRNNF